MAIQLRNAPKPLNTYEDLLAQVTSHDGIWNLEMMKLRDIHGAGKLGVHVTQAISDRLNSLGLGHYPEELPQQQLASVRLYVRGSPIGKLIEAVLTVDARSDRLLRESASNEDTQTIRKIRELVCE